MASGIRHLRYGVLALAVAYLLAGGQAGYGEGTSADPTAPVLTRVNQIHGLTPDQARKGFSVRLRAVVTYFDAVNRNKRSIVIDLATPEGLARARSLAATADVLVENFRPGLLDGLGLGYSDLSEANPALIYCSITGFGSTGRGAALPGYDLLVQAMGGLMSITGEPGGEPQKVGVALVDVLAGLFATVGILGALNHRHATGEGQLIEVDLLSSLLAALVNQASSFTVAGVVPERMGNEHPSIAPYAVFQTGDGRLVLAVGTDRQFQTLCEVIGAPSLAQDHRFFTNPARVANRDALSVELEELLAARPAADWAAALTEMRVPAGVVNDSGNPDVAFSITFNFQFPKTASVTPFQPLPNFFPLPNGKS